MANVAEGKPTKSFFVEMITRDISLEDCLLDLLDNAVDGARREVRGRQRSGETPPFHGYRASLQVGGGGCEIVDNCGGIPRDVAEHYAFRFGRVDSFAPAKLAIGLYGVGMKRAIFKLGKKGTVESRLGDSGFQVKIDVPQWRGDETNWDFPLLTSQRHRPKGTTVEIAPLWDHVAEVVRDPNFAAGLRQAISRDYAFLLAQGFSVHVNGRQVNPYNFVFRTGSGFAPMRTRVKTKKGVTVEVLAGFAESPPDTFEAEEEQKRKRDASGWYIACNDRVVLAGDKSARTVWGRDGFNRWHPQYRGFLGIVRFTADDPRQLPWTTTKRDIDDTAAVYRAALERMKSATERCIKYTEARRGDIDYAEKREGKAKPIAALEVSIRGTPRFPKIPQKTKNSNRISYTVTRSDLDQAKTLLRDPDLPNKEVGLRTFRYFMENAG